MESFQEGDDHTLKNLAVNIGALVAVTVLLIIFSTLIT